MSANTYPDGAPSPAPSSLAEVIGAEGGRVTFARFMELALTHPTLGYYSRVDRLLGRGGDFLTAPALSPFFNRTLARLVTELVDAALAQSAVDKPSVVELGGGEGHLAEGVLRFWESERPDLRDRIAYRIVEVGAGLRDRQAAAVAEFGAAGWDVGWGVDLEQACAGTHPVVMVGNEFLDTMPAHVIDVREACAREVYVSAADGSLTQTCDEVSTEAAAEMELLFGTLEPRRLEAFRTDGVLEVFPGLGDLTRRVAGLMPSGSLVNIDYGEWFPSVSDAGPPSGGPRWGSEGRTRRRRTVRGYFKQQLVLDPLARPGRQDLTADVDFAAVDLHGRREGFETVLFTTLAGFLRGGGAEDELRALRGRTPETTEAAEAVDAAPDALAADQPGADPLEADRQTTVLANLLDEQDLGGAFKLMVQVRE